MIIKVKTFEDGRKSYGTGVVHNSINNNLPVKVEEIEIDDEIAWKFLDNPDTYELSVVDGKGVITVK